MESKGGKIIWCCSRCHSPMIVRAGSVARQRTIYGLYATSDRNYYCAHCGHWEEWRFREKNSIKNTMPEIRNDVGFAHLDDRHHAKIFTAYSCRNARVTMKDFLGEYDVVGRRKGKLAVRKMS